MLNILIIFFISESRQKRKERHQKRKEERVDHKSRSHEKKSEEDEEQRERLERSKHRYESARVKTAIASSKQDEVNIELYFSLFYIDIICYALM